MKKHTVIIPTTRICDTPTFDSLLNDKPVVLFRMSSTLFVKPRTRSVLPTSENVGSKWKRSGKPEKQF